MHVALVLGLDLVMIMIVVVMVRVMSSFVGVRRAGNVVVHARVSTCGSVGVDLETISFHRLKLTVCHLHRFSLLHRFQRLPVLHQFPCLRCSLFLSLSQLALRLQHLHISSSTSRLLQLMLRRQRPSNIRSLQRQHQQQSAGIDRRCHFGNISMGLCDCNTDCCLVHGLLRGKGVEDGDVAEEVGRDEGWEGQGTGDGKPVGEAVLEDGADDGDADGEAEGAEEGVPGGCMLEEVLSTGEQRTKCGC